LQARPIKLTIYLEVADRHNVSNYIINNKNNPQPGKMLNNRKPFTLEISEFSGVTSESLRELKQ
jgi:hypothetical protein